MQKFFVSVAVASILLSSVSSAGCKAPKCQRENLLILKKDFNAPPKDNKEADRVKIYPKEVREANFNDGECVHEGDNDSEENPDHVIVYDISDWTARCGFKADSMKVWAEGESSKYLNRLEKNFIDYSGLEHDYCKDPFVRICVGKRVIKEGLFDFHKYNNKDQKALEGIYLWYSDLNKKYYTTNDNSSDDVHDSVMDHIDYNNTLFYVSSEDESIKLAWVPSNVSCKDAKHWYPDESCVEASSEICQETFNKLTQKNLFKYLTKKYHAMFFGSKQSFKEEVIEYIRKNDDCLKGDNLITCKE